MFPLENITFKPQTEVMFLASASVLCQYRKKLSLIKEKKAPYNF